MIEFSVSAMAAFSATRQVHRSFGHLIAAGHGSLLVVPVAFAAGDLRTVVDGCPVPWVEVWTLIDSQPSSPVAVPADLVAYQYPELASVVAEGWRMDFVPLGQAARPTYFRLTHRSGIRFAHV